MRLVQYLRYLSLIMIALGVCSSAQATEVTLDLDSKTAASDSEKLGTKAVQVKGQQGGVLIQNTTDAPQTFKLVIKGLTEQEYDVYVDGAYTGVKPAAVLRSGLELTANGLSFDPIQVKCCRALKPGLEAECKRLQGLREPSVEEGRALWSLRKALDSVSTGVRIDERSRALPVLVAPRDTILQKMVYPTELPAGNAVAGLANACAFLQNVRDTMYDGLTDLELRNSTVSVLTPVSLVAQYQVANGKRRVAAKLINNSSLPISSDISLSLPQGWTTDPAKLHLETKPGTFSSISIPLVKQSKDAEAPKSGSAVADVMITEDKFKACMQLKTEIEKQSE